MFVVFRNAAVRDLEDIADYIARDNPERARSFARELQEACLGLQSFPRKGPLLDPENKEIRKVVYGNYLILYRIAEDKIIILRILHGARGMRGNL